MVETDGPQPGGDDRITYTHDPVGRLLSATVHGLETPEELAPGGQAPPAEATSTFEWNDAGERIRVTDPEGRVREWTYDLDGREATFTVAPGTPEESTTSHGYNRAGWPTGVEDPRGMTLRYAHDLLGRETRRWAEEGGATIDALSFSHDAAGNMTEAEVEKTGLRTTWSYDPDGRPTEMAQGGATTEWGYDPATGLLSSLTTPAGATSYTWDPDGLLASLADPLTGVATTYGYDPDSGRPTSRVTGGLTWSRTYDPSGRVAAQEVTGPSGIVASFHLGYDRAGNVISKDQHVQGAPPAEQGEWTYRYDPAGRMVGATDPEVVETLYAYDGAGNRTGTKEGEDPAVLTSHDARGLPTETTAGTTYTHDPAGGLTALTAPEGDWSFSYDAWGRLRLAVPASGEVVSYALDALGRTASRTERGDVTRTASLPTTRCLSTDRPKACRDRGDS